jgi:hypothetical protein
MHFASLCALFFAASAAFAQQPMIVFAVDDRSLGPFIEPIVFVDQRAGCDECQPSFLKPPPLMGLNARDSAPETRAFVQRYYRKGAGYRIVSGGAAQGVATVVQPMDVACESLAAKVTLSKPIEGAVAIGSLVLPVRKNAPREPTEDEYAKVYDLAGRVLSLKGVSSSLCDEMESGRVVATDLNNDGRTDFVGDFEVVDKEKKIEHRLFLIAVGAPSGLTADYIWYYRADQMRDGDSDLLTFVDHEHFGGSPFDHVIVRTRGYESWDYLILGRDRTGNWQVIYEGGGGGC